MLTRLDRDTARAMVRVRSEGTITLYLQAELKEVQNRMTHVIEDVAMRQYQGKAQQLQDLLSVIEKSVETAEKLGA